MLTPKQKLWSNVYDCAIERSNIYFKEDNLERHKREHTTVMMTFGLGDSFWMKKL